MKGFAPLRPRAEAKFNDETMNLARREAFLCKVTSHHLQLS